MAAFLPPETEGVFPKGTAPTLDLSIQGQQGAMTAPHLFDAMNPYVPQQMQAVLLEVPPLFKYADNPDYEERALANLIQNGAITIEGIASTIANEGGETVAGMYGETFQFLVNSKYPKNTPTFTWPERDNASILNYWEHYSKMYLKEPVTGAPGIISAPKFLEAKSPQFGIMDGAFTTLFFIPDITWTRVVKAVIGMNMWPNAEIGENVMRRAVGEAMENPQVPIAFAMFTLRGAAPIAIAQSYLDSLDLANLLPFKLKANLTERNPGLAEHIGTFKDSILS